MLISLCGLWDSRIWGIGTVPLRKRDVEEEDWRGRVFRFLDRINRMDRMFLARREVFIRRFRR